MSTRTSSYRKLQSRRAKLDIARFLAPRPACATTLRSRTCLVRSGRHGSSVHQGRVLDHIGFDVKDLQAFVTMLEANCIKLDRPYTKNEQTGAALAFITDPWGTYIELNERPIPRISTEPCHTTHLLPLSGFRGEGVILIRRPARICGRNRSRTGNSAARRSSH